MRKGKRHAYLQGNKERREIEMKLETSTLFKKKFAHKENIRQLTPIELKKVQEILFDILCAVDDVCKKTDIPYCLCGGSALGAVRHHDFIPWDDDLDIFILRNSMEKFIETFEKTYGTTYAVSSPGYQNLYSGPSSRICKRGTVFRSYSNLGEESAGIGCDICILENTYNNWLMRLIHGLGAVSCSFLVSCRRFLRDKDILMKYAEGDREIEKSITVKASIGRLVSPWTYQQLVKFQYFWNSQCKKKNSRYVVCVNGRKHFFGEIYDRGDMMKPEMYQFHGKTFAVMGKTDSYLHHLYGDYMKIPKEEERENLVVFEFKLS